MEFIICLHSWNPYFEYLECEKEWQTYTKHTNSTVLVSESSSIWSIRGHVKAVYRTDPYSVISGFFFQFQKIQGQKNKTKEKNWNCFRVLSDWFVSADKVLCTDCVWRQFSAPVVCRLRPAIQGLLGRHRSGWLAHSIVCLFVMNRVLSHCLSEVTEP